MSPEVTCHNLFIDYGYRAREIITTAKIGPSFILGSSDVFSPYPQDFQAVWDTGAVGTSISNGLAKKLGLAQTGYTDVEGVNGPATCNTFLISLALPNGIIFPEIEVADCEGNIGCDILIGMDIIGMGDFAVCNRGGKTTFSFRVPSIAAINFADTHDPAYAPKRKEPVRAEQRPSRNSMCPCGSGKKFKKCCGAG